MNMKRAPYKGLRLPDDEIYLTVRLCFKAICMGNKPAAYLLSALLFRYDPDTSQDLEQVKQFRIQCSQESLIEAMCEECSTKTIHDAGIPGLQLFGYLEVDESTSPITYTVHMDRVRAMLNVYMSLKKQYPSDRRRLSEELEKVLIRNAAPLFPDLNKRNFHVALEKVLIRNRETSNSSGETSNSRRGRKPKQGAARDPKNVPPKNIKNMVSNKNEQEREKTSTSSSDVTPAFAGRDVSLSRFSLLEAQASPQESLEAWVQRVCLDTNDKYPDEEQTQTSLPVGYFLDEDEEEENTQFLCSTLQNTAVPDPHVDDASPLIPQMPHDSATTTQEPGKEASPISIIPIAIGNTNTPPEHKTRQGTSALTLPARNEVWTSQTMLRVFEYHHGRQYPNSAKRKADRTRDVELEACGSLCKMDDLWTGDTEANSAFLLRLITQQETRLNNWWLDHNGHVMPHQFVEKDRIHTMADEVARLDKKAHFSVVGSHGSGSQRGEDKPRRYSSFDDPDYDMSGEFYPSEAEKREEQQRHATAAAQ